ncbi:MAG: class 1 fructose-bisphosphatase [Bacteroidota bacterium]|nr:class 1 fructose-bisphosphatase [Bacteroidota bacterium]
MENTVQTLGQFIVERQNEFSYATGELSRLLGDLTTASKIINREVNKAGLVNILGSTGKTNVQGEEVKKLDIYANEQLISALFSGGEVCVMGSEEDDDIILPDNEKTALNGKYVVLIDPLDGSSNIDVNASIGTIFSIYRRVSAIGNMPDVNDCLQLGTKQVAAGYVIYGSSTILVYSTGKGVNGFTLDPSIGEFCLSHPDIKMPAEARTYSINEGNAAHFSSGVNKYMAYCKEDNKEMGRPYSTRYIGTFVADFHRNLLTGGIFIYPGSKKAPKGKLRLNYEVNPLAFLAEQSGGKAIDGVRRVLEIQPESLHQRTPLFIGSSSMVEKVREFLSVENFAVTQAD